MSKNARARRVRRRLILGVALTTAVSAGSVATAVSAQAAPTPPGGPRPPYTTPTPPPGTTETRPPTSTPSPDPAPSSPKPKPAPPAVPSHPAAGAGHFDNSLIATTALAYVGRWGGQACVDADRFRSGQCREFVDCVVSLATGGKIWPVDPGGNYQVGFSSVGAVPVAPADAVGGDIIQIGDHDDSNPLHTAIVLTNNGDGTYLVVDANYVGQPVTPELVGVHVWTPPAGAQFWRLGAVSPAHTRISWHGTSTDNGAGTFTGLTGSTKQTPDTSLLQGPAAPVLSTNTVNGLASGTITVRSADADPAHPSARMRYWIDGKSGDAIDNAPGGALLSLDTTTLTDGPHQISAQAVASDGAISPLSAPTTITVTNHQLTIAVAAPNTPLLSGIVALPVGAAPAADLAQTTLTIDGKVAQQLPPTASGVVNLDTTTLIAGPHQVSIAVTNREGQTVTWGPVTVTVTGAATGPRAVLPSAKAGRGDLVAVDATGKLLRYPWVSDGTFGTPQPVADGFGDVTSLVAGHFTGTQGAAQLLAVRKDGSAHLYSFDATGKLADLGPVSGTQWNTFTRLAAGVFTKGGQEAVVGIDAAGHAQLITVSVPVSGSGSSSGTDSVPSSGATSDAVANSAANSGATSKSGSNSGSNSGSDSAAKPGPSAKVESLSVSPVLGTAVTIEAVPGTDGTDQLLSVDGKGAVASFTFDAVHGFVPVKGAPTLQLPAPTAATAPVIGGFVGDGSQLLVTDTTGQTWVVSITQLDRPAQGAVFQEHATPGPVTAAQGQRRLSVDSD
jgi:hypothetical protein